MNKEMKTVVATGGVFGAAALLMGYWVYTTSVTVTELNEANAALEASIAALKVNASPEEIKRLTVTRDDLQQAVDEYVKILPPQQFFTDEAIIDLFSNKAKTAEVSVLEINTSEGRSSGAATPFGQPPIGPSNKTDFEKVLVSLRLEGKLENFVKFLASIEGHQSFLQVESFTLTSPPGNAGDLKLSANVRVASYRYNAAGT